MKHSPKLAIIQSLDAMDQVQMEKVLQYIKGVLVQNGKMDYRAFKSEAMREIRQALLQNKQAVQA